MLNFKLFRNERDINLFQNVIFIKLTADNSDMFDLEDAFETALLSSTSPSSDSMEKPRRAPAPLAADNSAMDRSRRLPGGTLIGSRLRPPDVVDSFRNCSKKDI